MPETKLLPCPFCGGKMALVVCREPNYFEGKLNGYQYQVVCDASSGKGCGASCGYHKEWNRRLKMTIDEAISHALEVAEQKECKMTSDDGCTDVSMKRCAAEHRQLAEWLTELKDTRAENKVLMAECDRLIKEKGELLGKVSGGDVLRICQLEEQLKAAKRLLKAAVEDFHDVLTSQIKITNFTLCGKCKYYLNCNCKDECLARYDLKQWRFADEALKLIGEESERNA